MDRCPVSLTSPARRRRCWPSTPSRTISSTATREAAIAELKRAGLTHEIVIFPGVGHAFFNDTGKRYNAKAAAQAYRMVLDWLGRYVT